MSKKLNFDVEEEFAVAQQAVERQDRLKLAESRVLELTGEIERLKIEGGEADKLIQELRSGLKEQGGILLIPVDLIDRNLNQPRQTFNPDTLSLLARSLETDGQQEPVILIRVPKTERFILFDGERRWRCAQRLSWKTLKAVIVPEPEELQRNVLSATIHREGINALDLSEALVEVILQQEGMEKCDSLSVPRLLNAGIKRLKAKKMISQLSKVVDESPEIQKEILLSLDLKDEEYVVFSTILSFQLNPHTVSTHTFPALTLDDDLKQAIRHQGLGATQAKSLQRLSPKNLRRSSIEAKKIRAKALQKVLDQELSVRETRVLVASILTKYSPERNDSSNTKAVQKVIQSIRTTSVEGIETSALKDLQKALNLKLEEIEKAIHSRP